MAICDFCDLDYFKAIATFYGNNELALAFLRDHGVLPTKVNCPKCLCPCTFREKDHLWRCRGSSITRKTQERTYCDYAVSDYKGSFLSSCHFAPWKLILFVNHFLSRHWDHRTMHNCLGLSPNTTVVWRSFCSEVTDHWISNQDSEVAKTELLHQFFIEAGKLYPPLSDQQYVGKQKQEVESPTSHDDSSGRLKLDKAGKKRKPKDANQPKRATTAYFFFMANCREQAKKAGKNISKVAEFTKECSEKWKNLSPAQRKPFDEKAAKERARYEKEMAEYKGKKSAADPDKPKRPQTSYFLFLAEFRKNYVPKDGQENAAHKMILKEAGEKWREMGAEEKRQYEKMSEEEGKKYKLAMAEYNKKSGGGITGGSAAKKVKVEDSVDDDDDEEDEEEEEEDEVEEDEEEEEEDEEDEDED